MIGYVTFGTKDLQRAVAFHDALPATVGRVYRKALELGGKDEGAAGPHSEGFYVGYFRDLDGNKPCVFKAG